jgi:hypothetical protein
MNKKLFIALFPLVGLLISCGGDSEEDMEVSCEDSSLEISITSTTDAACNEPGSIVASATGSSGIKYKLDDGLLQPSGTFNVSAGTYTVTAVDKNDCTASAEVTINAVGNAIVISEVVSTIAGCGSSNGQITVTASGGESTLMYRLDGGTEQASNVFSSVAAGNHTVEVSDGVCASERIEKVLSGVSLETEVMPLIALKCAITGCHNGDNSSIPNWNNKANVINRASTIKEFTQSGFMPQTGSLSAEQKALIACWVDDGALDN